MSSELVIPNSCRVSAANTVHFVVDCLSVQKVACGLAPLTSTFYRPPFVRIARSLAHIAPRLRLGRDVADDPVLWVPREDNKLADLLCNVTMDRKSSWGRTWANVPEDCLEFSLLAFSDGGRRNDKCSASAWAVAVGYPSGISWDYNLLEAGGIFHDQATNSFLAETLALEMATLAVRRLVESLQIIG